LSEALARVPPEARHEYENITAITWVTYETLRVVHDTVADIMGVDAEVLAERVARLCVERSFTTVWRVLLRITSDEAIVVRTPMFYSRSRNIGTMSARIIEPGRSESIVSGFPTMPDRDIMVLAVSVETVLTLAGRRDVKCRGERSPDGAIFFSRWRVT